MENEKWEKFKDLIKKISSEELLEFKKIILNEIETRDASGEIKKIYLIKILDQPDHLIYYYSNFDNLSTDSVLKEIYYHLKRNYKFYRFSRNKILDIKIGDMDINLKGEAVVDKLSDDFDILAQIKMINTNSPPISTSKCVELQVMVREMMEYETPSQNYWDHIEKFIKMKYKAYPGQ